MCSSGIRSGNNNNNSSSSVVFIYGRLFGVISPANTPDSWLVLSRSETRSDPKKVLTKPVFHHPETIHQTRCKALGWRRGTKCHGKGKKIRECKCGLPCLLSPLCPWWWWRREWHREEWGQSWQGSKHRPSLSEILEGLAHIMPYGSWIKEGWREGNRKSFTRREQRHSPGSPRLYEAWLGTEKSPWALTGDLEVTKKRSTGFRVGLSKWSSWGQQQAGSESLGSAYAEAGGDRVCKKTLLTSARGNNRHYTCTEPKKIYCRLSWDQPSKRKQTFHSLPQHGTEFRERDWNDFTLKWRGCTVCILHFITVKFTPLN